MAERPSNWKQRGYKIGTFFAPFLGLGLQERKEMSLQAVLAKYKEISSSKREKGDFFERLMKAYLLKAPKYSATIKEVWLWNDFPLRRISAPVKM